MKKVNSRLPDTVIPSNYELTLEPSADMLSFKGSVAIKARVTKPTKEIVLHAKDLIIKNTNICVGTQCLLPIVEINKEAETITIKNMKVIPAEEIELHLEFEGSISQGLAGIYRSKYELNGKTSYLITTQCESAYARRIFPCFDEPDKKATFDINVVIDKKLKAVSNMPIKSESIEGNKKKVIFKTTPKMSVYLFYLGVGDFEFLEDNYKGVKLRVVTTPSKSDKGRFALEQTKKYLEFFEKYSEIPYPLEKLDLLAIPDFSAAAMENWGAITFREIVLLIDENSASSRIKRSAEVIAHELWHQWSGNLVTMKWWNDLWLNESFANYMAYKAVAYYNPEWNIWEDYLSTEAARGMFIDTLKTTHPIEVEVNSPNEIEQIFDEISYAKGGSVIRMLESYVGEENFRIGVSNYLKKNEYGSAESSDLWETVSEATQDKTIKDLMKYWISEPGYPMVSIKKKKESIEVTQERCNKKTNQVWPIPLSIISEEICYNKLLNKKTEIYKINASKLKVNHEQYGFYRTRYDSILMEQLGSLIQNKSLGVADRWGVHNDLWALCSIGEEKLVNYLKFIDNYQNEENLIILSDMASSLKKLDRLFIEEKNWPKIKESILKKITPIYKKILSKLGWTPEEKEPMSSTLLRSLAIGFCGFAEDKETIVEAKARYARSVVPINTADAIYYIVAKTGDDGVFNKMLAQYKKEEDLERKMKLLVALYLFKQPELIKKALDFCIGKEVRTQDLRYVFSNIIANPHISKTIKNWFFSNWENIKKYQDTHYIFEDMLNGLILSQRDSKESLEINNFLKKNKVDYERTKANAFEILDMNINLIKNNQDLLKKE
ncbi:MAG: M1 family metallopeptidase [Candidatus Pacearchaeota archaeon]